MRAAQSPPTNRLLLHSPTERVTAELSSRDGRLYLAASFDGRPFLLPSPLGLALDGPFVGDELLIAGVDSSAVDETWTGIAEKTPTIRNHHREYRIGLDIIGAGTLVVRLFDDGLAYRYELVGEPVDSLRLHAETTELRLPADYLAWAYNGEHPNVGPLGVKDSLPAVLRTPVVFELADDFYLGMHEAAVVEHAPFDLVPSGEGRRLNFRVPTAAAVDTFLTSWRTFLVGQHPGRLVESNILTNLNESCKIEDTSWIRPGKSMWDWRVAGYQAPDGFEYGLNTASHLRMIDFTAANNIQYLLIDANWYGHEFADDSDPVSAREGVDIEKCMAHAGEKGVGVILYLNDKGAKRFGLERVLRQFAEWGAVGVKYGFMQGTATEKVRQTRRVVEMCAKYRLMVDFHDNPIKPSGDRRTWPNLITREYCHAQADGRRSYQPGTMVSSAFINAIAGPLDYTNGWFDLDAAHLRDKVWEEIPGTVAAEVAKLVVVHSGWTVLPDAPEAYLAKEDLFACVRAMPAHFDDFRVLGGDIAAYVSVARRAGEDWFVGTITNEKARAVDVDLSFLSPGKTYRATVYEDAERTHYLRDKESYRVREIGPVTSGDTVRAMLAPGGGHTIHLVAQ